MSFRLSPLGSLMLAGLVTVSVTGANFAEAAPKKRKATARTTTTRSVPTTRRSNVTDAQLDTWWINKLSDNRFIRPHPTIALTDEERGCVGNSFRPAIGAKQRQSVEGDPKATIQPAEAEALATSVETCKLTVYVLTFAFASAKYFPSTYECLQQEWQSRPTYARTLLLDFVLILGVEATPAVQADSEAAQKKCITPEQLEALRNRPPDPADDFKPVTNTLP
jgi:hypothetical protein